MDHSNIRKSVLIELYKQRGKPIVWTDMYQLEAAISFGSYDDCVEFLRDLESDGLINLLPLTEETGGSTDKIYKVRITEAGVKYVEINYQ